MATFAESKIATMHVIPCGMSVCLSVRGAKPETRDHCFPPSLSSPHSHSRRAPNMAAFATKQHILTGQDRLQADYLRDCNFMPLGEYYSLYFLK